LEKTFEALPGHQDVRIQAKYHMFDNWNGEYGYLKVDNNIVWTLNGKTPTHENAFNFGGLATADPKYNALIDVTLSHSGKSVKLEFGSSLNQEPCEASYGIDDVVIFVK